MKKPLHAIVIYLALIMGGAMSATADDLILAGGSSAASIVIGTDASEVEQYAAEELQRCIRIMSGIELPIVLSDGAVSGSQLVIGTPATSSLIDQAKARLRLGGGNAEQIAVLREGNIIYLAGATARASLYATYTFLESVLGVRWLWPGASGEFIPTRQVVTVGEVSIFDAPDIQTRTFTNVRSTDPETGTWEARNRINMVAINKNADPNATAIKELLKKGFQTRIAGHFVVLPESILSAHPEYAALNNNSRDYAAANTAQLCWGNPGVQQEVANMLAGLWDTFPFVDVMHFYPADNQNYCDDELCAAMAPDVSTRWQKFSQIVMEKADQQHPDKRYWTYAYQGYKDVPQFVASRFETIGYTLYEASYRHLLSSGFSGSAGAVAEIDGWNAKGANMGIRGYEYIMFRDPMFVPLVSWEVDQMSWLADKGLSAYLSELRPFASPSGAAPENTYFMCNRLNLYAASKASWDTSISADSIVNDWYKTIYGPAAEEMIAYYWDMEQLWRNAPGDIQEYNNTPSSQVNNIFSPEDFIRLNGYLTRARTIAANLAEPQRARVVAQLDLEGRMLGNWQRVYNFTNNLASRFEAEIAKVETVGAATWNTAPKLSAFRNESGEAVPEQTIVSTVWTETDLWLRIEAQDTDIASRIANGSEHDDVAILSDDCIELYLQPDPAKAAYMHLAVNTLGKKYDAISRYGGTDFDISWDAEWTATPAIDGDGWSVLVKIPFSAVGISAADKAAFKFSVKRSRAGRADNSGWPDASYYNAGSFGTATLVAEATNPVANRVILFDQGGTSSGNVSTEFQERGWEVVSGISGEEELAQKLGEDAAVLLLRYSSKSAFLSDEFYANELKNYIEKGRVVLIATARDVPIDNWFPGTPAVTWSGYNQNLSPSRSTYQHPGSWQTYPNNLSNEIKIRPTPVTAYMPEDGDWRQLLKMRMRDGSEQAFLLSRRIGKGLLVLTSSNVGYSGGYEVFGSRNITNAVKLIENFKAEIAEHLTPKRAQTITFDPIPTKVFGEPEFELSAVSDAGLPVTLTSSDPAVATIEDGVVQLTGIGTAVITASQEGDENYAAAESVSRELVVVADTEAPTTPEGLSAMATDSTVTLTWSASYDFIGVRGYEVYMENELVRFSTTTASRITGLRAAETYNFAVIATDAAGNRSAAAAITVTTPDTQAPAVINTLTLEKTTADRVALRWDETTDNVGVMGYSVYRNGEQLNPFPLTVTDYVAERPRGKDVYEFTVQAFDAAGNVSPPGNIAVAANGRIMGDNPAYTIYPNPANGKFSVRISAADATEVTITLFDNFGTMVRQISGETHPAKHEYEINNLLPGTYILHITLNGEPDSQIVIVK